jgi:hypothetical protein
MKDCIKRKMSLLKKRSFFHEEYEIVEIVEHEFVNVSLELLKNESFFSFNNRNVIYCRFCGEKI